MISGIQSVEKIAQSGRGYLADNFRETVHHQNSILSRLVNGAASSIRGDLGSLSAQTVWIVLLLTKPSADISFQQHQEVQQTKATLEMTNTIIERLLQTSGPPENLISLEVRENYLIRIRVELEIRGDLIMLIVLYQEPRNKEHTNGA